MEQRFVPQVESALRQAGWFPGRNVGEALLAQWDAMWPLFPAARQALAEFGDLYVDLSPDLTRGVFPFCIDTVQAWRDGGPADDWLSFEEALSRRVYPLGFFQYRSYGFGERRTVSGLDAFCIDEHGRVFFYYFDCILVGATIDVALRNLIMGGGRVAWNSEKNVPRV